MNFYPPLSLLPYLCNIPHIISNKQGLNPTSTGPSVRIDAVVLGSIPGIGIFFRLAFIVGFLFWTFHPIQLISTRIVLQHIIIGTSVMGLGADRFNDVVLCSNPGLCIIRRKILFFGFFLKTFQPIQGLKKRICIYHHCYQF